MDNRRNSRAAMMMSMFTALDAYARGANPHNDTDDCVGYEAHFEKLNMKGKSAKEMGTVGNKKKKSRRERKQQKNKGRR